MMKAGTLRLLGALMLLSGCGSGTDTVAMPPAGGSEEGRSRHRGTRRGDGRGQSL